MNKYPILLPIGLLLLLSLLTFWINQNVQEEGLRLRRLSGHAPDYMLYHFVSTRTNAQGETKYVLAAAEMRHFPAQDTTELLRPRFTQFGVDKPYTQIMGQRGKILPGGDVVEFSQKVKVTRQGTATKGEMQLQTERLWLEPNKDIAHTNLPVTIRQKPATVITATGLRFDNKASTVDLFNRVHVHYERAQPPVARASRPATAKQNVVKRR